jgi:hypothetical protein
VHGAADVATYARFLFPLVVMTVGLTVGYIVKLRRTVDCLPLSRGFTRSGMIYLDPLNIILALWGQSFAHPKMLVLPVIGLAIALLATVPAWVVTRVRRTPPRRAGVLVGASLFSNLGPTFGTFLSYVLAGEAGFAAATLFTVYFYPTFYTLGLLVGRRYSTGAALSPGRFIADAMRDAANRNPVLAVFVGLLLGAFGPARPAFCEHVTAVVVPVTTLVYLVGIGMTLNPGRVRDYVPHGAVMGAVKFIYTPLLGLGFAWLYRVLNPADAVSPQVIFLQSCMPTAIFSLIMANLFDLDRDLANTLWLLTNAAGILLSPAILWLAGMA